MNRYPGRMVETGIYPGVNLGNPDINYVSLADGYGIEAERVTDPGKLAATLKRAKRAIQEGRPYLVDVKLETMFPGAESASKWYDSWSIAQQKRRIKPV
jgi:thiamine pyrophosphate-dependent acetolactate synthase large subunit-like protein